MAVVEDLTWTVVTPPDQSPMGTFTRNETGFLNGVPEGAEEVGVAVGATTMGEGEGAGIVTEGMTIRTRRSHLD